LAYVIFAPSDTLVGYLHIMIVDTIKDKHYLINTMSSRNIQVAEISERKLNYLLNKFEHYQVKLLDNKARTGDIVFLSCVSLTKLYLGIKNRFIYTPEHLRQHLNNESISALEKFKRSCMFVYFYIFRGHLF
jgi:hypothetical protein